MDGQLYQLTLEATGEVRDADGNLISSEPVTATVTVTEDQARSLGLDIPEDMPPH